MLHPIYRFGPPTYSLVRFDGPVKVIFDGYGSTILAVGGRLAKNPEMLKGKKPVSLSEFKVGEHVLVGWKSTASGPVIERLIAG